MAGSLGFLNTSLFSWGREVQGLLVCYKEGLICSKQCAKSWGWKDTSTHILCSSQVGLLAGPQVIKTATNICGALLHAGVRLSPEHARSRSALTPLGGSAAGAPACSSVAWKEV